MGPTAEQREKRAEQSLRFDFDSTLPDRLARRTRVRVHDMIPMDFFSAASRECGELFVAGSFYGCITLVQSVAEGLGKFLAEKNTIKVYNNHDKLIAELSNRGVISATAREAFKAIRGKDRNDFHHLNKRIPQDRDKLEKRAEGCMNSLYTIESEVFAYEHDGTGRIIMKHRKYWPPDDDRGMVRVWRRRTP